MPTSPSKRKMAGEACMCEEEKEKKNIPGSSLIEAPDVAGFHHDKKKVRGDCFIGEWRKGEKEGTRSSGEVELVGDSRGGGIIKENKRREERERRENRKI